MAGRLVIIQEKNGGGLNEGNGCADGQKGIDSGGAERDGSLTSFQSLLGFHLSEPFTDYMFNAEVPLPYPVTLLCLIFLHNIDHHLTSHRI